MKQTKNKLWASAFLPLAFASSALTGQSAAEDVALDETVVVGNSLAAGTVSSLGTPTAVLDVPQSLSITTADVIDERGFNSIGDIIDYTPGVNQSQGEGHRDAVVFRGVRSTADFFVDGVRDDVQYYRPLYNVEQVEILRGPNALFFGRGGAGGVLNRVSKKGVIGQDFNAYKFGVDSFGAAELQVDSNSAVNEDVAVRINAYYERYANHRDYYDGDGYGVNPTVQFKLSDQTTLNASYEYLDHTRFIDRGIPTDPTTGEPVDALNGVFFGDKDLNESEFEAHVLRLDLAHSFSDETAAKVTLSYGDYDKAYANFYADKYDAGANTVDLKGYIDTTNRSTLTLSSSLSHDFETGTVDHALLLGAEYLNTSNDNDRYKASTSSGVNIFTDLPSFSSSFSSTAYDDTSADLDVMSIFIQDTVALSESFDLVLGARFDTFELDVTGIRKGGSSADGSSSDDNLSPRVGFVFKPVDDLSVYASYSETFVPQSGEQYADLAGKEALDANEFTNLELGAKFDIQDGFSLSAAVFKIEQDLVESFGDGSRIVRDEIDGFELQFTGQITSLWSINAGYSFLDGETHDGDRPFELPENMFSLWNYYQVSEKLGLGLGAIYQDESQIKDKSGYDPAVLPDYVRVDAAAYYTINEDLSLQLNIENVLDETYYPSSHFVNQATVGAPINARISISGRF